MNEKFNGIKAVGFDLDQTLYEADEKINSKIRIEVAKVVLKKMPNLKNIERAMEFVENMYKEIGSRTLTLRSLGFKDAENVIYECFTKADFVDLLKRDDKLVSVLSNLKNRYVTFLITGTPKDLAIPRLRKLGLDLNLFDKVVFGDSNLNVKKIDGSMFKYFLEQSIYKAIEHVYVGDSLKADIIPAKLVGMKTIAVGRIIDEADFSIDKIYEIEKLLL